MQVPTLVEPGPDGRPQLTAAWWSLELAMRDRIDRIVFREGDRRRLRNGFRGLLRDGDTGEEFCAWFIDAARRRALEGTLLGGFDPSRGTPPVEYLTASSLLRKRAIDFADSLRRPAAEPAELAITAPAPGDVAEGQVDRLLAGPWRLRLASAGNRSRISRPELYGGVQLWPKLDPDAATTATVRGEMDRAVSGGVPGAELAHREAQRTIAERRKEIASIRWPETGGWATDRRSEAALRRLQARALIAPILAPAMAELLTVSIDNAHQLKRRYRALLAKHLVEDLSDLLRPMIDEFGLGTDEDDNDDDSGGTGQP